MTEVSFLKAEVANAQSHQVEQFKSLAKYIDDNVFHPKRVSALVNEISVEINKQIEESISHGWSFCNSVFYCEDIENTVEFHQAIEIITVLLKESGYRVNEFHTYSKSWQHTSGKYGYLYIGWSDYDLDIVK